jgi:hypothetical protein
MRTLVEELYTQRGSLKNRENPRKSRTRRLA